MRVVVTGAGGMLGTALLPVLAAAGHEAVGLDRRQADVANLDEVRGALGLARPQWVVHLAALTRVDDCEADAERAHRVNGLGARNVAQAAAELGAPILALSTDYVFPGDAARPYREDDATGPRSAYGASKLAGELGIREVHPRHIIVRTAWLYGRGGTNFVDTLLGRVRAGDPLRVVDDQRGSPTWASDLAPALVRLVAAGRYGTYHCTNSGDCTWHDLAVHVLGRAGIVAPVARIDSATLARPARRPAYSVMSNRSYEHTTGHRMPPWQDAVDRYLGLGAAPLPASEEAR